LQRALAQDAPDRPRGPLPRRAARAIGHRDVARLQRLEARDRLPQPAFHLIGLRREELERDLDAPADIGTAGQVKLGHQAVSLGYAVWSWEESAISRRRSRASHSRTVRPASSAGAKERAEPSSSPASSSHSPIWLSEKPSRTWACSSRRNSSACGAKSTMISRPDGRISFAASAIATPGSSR